MPGNGPVVAVALSARALAQGLVRAGHRVIALDLFNDRDTRSLSLACQRLPGSLAAGIDPDRLVEAVGSAVRAAGAEPVGIVWGAGFEDRPDALEMLARRWRVFGNDAATVRRIKCPEGFFSTLDGCGIATPEIALDPPADPAGWLVKQAGKSGGWHVRPAEPADGPAPGRYFQRLVPGRSVSALFAARGGEAAVIGFSGQWSAPAPGVPFRYGGAVQPAAVDDGDAAAMTRAVRLAAQAFALTGLNSADFIIGVGGGPWLIEINPRPGATLDIFDDSQARLMALHLDPAGIPDHAAPCRPRPARAAGVVYANRFIPSAGKIRWPGWTADRPADGGGFEAGTPVCTVLAEAGTAAGARRLAVERMAKVLAML